MRYVENRVSHTHIQGLSPDIFPTKKENSHELTKLVLDICSLKYRCIGGYSSKPCKRYGTSANNVNVNVHVQSIKAYYKVTK